MMQNFHHTMRALHKNCNGRWSHEFVRVLTQFVCYKQKWDPTWRIIPGLGYVVNNHGDPKSPKDRVVGPLPNGLNCLYMGVILTTYKSLDDPPSTLPLPGCFTKKEPPEPLEQSQMLYCFLSFTEHKQFQHDPAPYHPCMAYYPQVGWF